MPNRLTYAILAAFMTFTGGLMSQNFFFGADLSYVNEMEDCGVVYHENGVVKEVHRIFADNGCNLVRLRLWHTPSWYDTLNAGHRYADFQDVRKSIQRAKASGMQVLLDFQLSDFWADPSRQLCPAAWLGVVDNLPLLKDSLYNYVSGTLQALHSEGLMPEMVQIGNETNRGILLSPAVNDAGWSLDWNRNSQLFSRAIQAVRDVEASTGQSVKVALHIAGPANAGWLMQGFWNNGVTDVDIIGLSYYWAWHMPASITDAGNVVAQMRQLYPGKEVMIFETAYIWTTQANDNANNIISQVHPNYAPASPDNQRRWLVDLTQEMINKGASGVIYWEPAWVSSPCWTPWGQGSHQEHAAFFDFQNNLIPNGGIQWMSHPYDNLVASAAPETALDFLAMLSSDQRFLEIQIYGLSGKHDLSVQILGMQGNLLATEKIAPANGNTTSVRVLLPPLASGIYYAVIHDAGKVLGTRGFSVRQR